ncbi:PDR/VanB family oxidoreductase [Variovorax sp. J31P179]|uniref:PDR/VanB family oxidoreductase n=1 Tax=Variovorax sp. J31P179 TaxID=3053508 RepID=UPI002578ECD8|nr:PDR/VanB family oxidoreductase [Variovorax sp. J31P179]MDM0084739.1 PDR/VanB family oxidoreductase [Variovorax sp. J31P179]
MARKHIDVEVFSVRQLTPRVREFRLRTLDGAPLPAYGPGAHVEVHTGNAQTGLVVRHYSLIGGDVEADDTRDTCRIAVQREDRGGGSAYIHANFEVGTRLQISAPTNNFPLDRRDHHSLLIAGGIGITPIFSMVRSLARRRREFTVVYAGREPEFMAYREALVAVAGHRVRLHISGGQDTGKLDLDALIAAQPVGTTAYVCGPAAMVEATQAAGRAAGWEAERIRSELFGAGPQGDEVAFDVELKRSGRVVRVGKDVSILDALMAAKVDVLWDCRRGECGLCPQSVLKADGPIQHRDQYLSPEEREAADTLCICVSRIRGERLVLDL